MLAIFAWIVMTLAILGAVYLYGVYVGTKHGVKVGRSQSDAEWAVYMEHGAAGLPT